MTFPTHFTLEAGMTATKRVYYTDTYYAVRLSGPTAGQKYVMIRQTADTVLIKEGKLSLCTFTWSGVTGYISLLAMCQSLTPELAKLSCIELLYKYNRFELHLHNSGDTLLAAGDTTYPALQPMPIIEMTWEATPEQIHVAAYKRDIWTLPELMCEATITPNPWPLATILAIGIGQTVPLAGKTAPALRYFSVWKKTT